MNELEAIQTICPATMLQGGMYFHHQFDKTSRAYVIQLAIEVTGLWDTGIFARSLDFVVGRHDALRANFAYIAEKGLRQIIYKVGEKRIAVKTADIAELSLVMEGEYIEEFDLNKGALFRALVAEGGRDSVMVVLTFHHIIMDGWSMGVVLRDLFSTYSLMMKGVSVPSEKPWSLGEYSRWRNRMGEEDVKNYWTGYLLGYERSADVAWGTFNPNNYELGEIVLDLEIELIRKLRILCAAEGVTESTLLQTAWSVLLQGYRGRQDVVNGSVISGRPAEYPGIEDAVGLFINTVPVRFNASMESCFLDSARKLQEESLRSDEMATLSLAKVQECWGGGAGLIDHLFVFESYPMERSEFTKEGGLNAKSVRVREQTSYNLNIILLPNAEKLTLKISFNRKTISADMIERIAQNYIRVIEQVVQQPTLKIGDIEVVSEREKKLLTTGFSNPRENSPIKLCIHELFEEQVLLRPDAIAVEYENQRITYWELNAKSNQLARRLRAQKVKPDDLVAILAERSVELIIALLGVLKAGGAYVPIDPGYPQDRIDFMLRDSNCGVILIQAKFDILVAHHKSAKIAIDSPRMFTGRTENLRCNVTPNNLAYVIYTSGSTGQPKGVLVEHRNVVRLFAATQSWFEFGPTDIWTQFHSYAFDFSVWEIFGALLYGGKLIVVPYWITREPSEFWELIVKARVTCLNQTPSAFIQLSDVECLSASSDKAALKHIIFGGEALDFRTLQPWLERHGDEHPRLINMYGITETTVHVTYRPIRSTEVRNETRSLIGIPIQDNSVVLLDMFKRLCPIGVAGEIAVGGMGVARGYLGRDELTRERFVPLKFHGSKEKRWYLSGDLARYSNSGDLEFLGRKDQQVKIRGHRIELGEITAAILECPDINQAITIVRKKGTLAELCTFVVAGKSFDAKGIRGMLSRRLPDYMIPAHITQVQELPLNINGKIDVKRLSEIAIDTPNRLDRLQDSMEEALRRIWEDVLEIPSVSSDENFFNLGGDSIKAITVGVYARRVGINATIRKIFENPTPESLARVCRTYSSDKDETSCILPLSLLEPGDRDNVPCSCEDAYPLTRLQLGMIFHGDFSTKTRSYHNVCSLLCPYSFNEKLFHETLQSLMDRHKVFRTSFHIHGFGEPIQLVQKHVIAPLTVFDFRSEPKEMIATKFNRWFADEKLHIFDLEKPPLIRFYVHINDEHSFQFSWTKHHAILDGWSMTKMSSWILDEYNHRLMGSEVQLIAGEAVKKQTEFRDYVAAERRAIASIESKDYWKRILMGAEFAEIPRWNGDRGGRPGLSRSVFRLPLAGFAVVARKAGVSMKSILLAGHVRVLAEITGRDDLVTGVVSNGRLETEGGTEALGLFLNTIPMRINVGGTWIDLIRQCFRAEVEAIQHRRYPLFDILRATGKETLFESAFNYTDFYTTATAASIPTVQDVETHALTQTNFGYLLNAILDREQQIVTFALDSVETSRPRLESEQLSSICQYLECTYRQMMADLNDDCLRLPIVPEKETNETVISFNDTAIDFPTDILLHELFEMAAEEHPERIALICSLEKISYGSLNHEANWLSRFLIQKGVGSGVVVGIFAKRSIHMVVAVLAVLKAGGCYIPIDPDQPAARAEKILVDSRASMLLTNGKALERPIFSGEQINIEDLDLARENQDNPGRRSSIADLAYIIYTSGSTGHPKGVMIDHSAVVNTILDINKRFDVQSADCVLSLSSLAFDLSVYDIFGPLAVGGSVLIADDEERKNPSTWPYLIRNSNVTIWNSVPTLMQMLVDELAEGKEHVGKKLRLILLSGDWIPVQLPGRIRDIVVNPEIISMGGATEASIWSIYYRVGDVPAHWPSVPYGRPLGNQQYYVLNERLNPCPVGVPGRLYIGGRGLATGYRNDPDKTHASFIEGQKKMGRIYNTGDLGRHLPTGFIEFLGRADSQIKIRGQRIELGEVESALSKFPGISQVAVVVLGKGDDGKLYAYYVSEVEIDAKMLHEFLTGELPIYMVPSCFHRIDTLPLTPNGKLDRKGLPAPRAFALRSMEQPLGSQEAELAEIWKKTLNVANVNRYDDIFSLGGHSLTVVRIAAGIRKTMNREVPLKLLFEKGTVADISYYLDNDRKGTTSDVVFGREVETGHL